MTTLLLLPGLHGTTDLFFPLLTALSALSLDLAVSIAEFPFEAIDYTHVEAAVRLPEGRIALLAESFSGPLAIRLAVRLKVEGRLSALILVATFARSPIRWFPWWLVPKWAPVPPLAIVVRLLLGSDADPERVRELAIVIKRIPPKTALARLRTVARCDERTRLSQLIGVPTLYLQARDDLVVGPQGCADFAPLKPLIHVLNAPHLVLQTRAIECAKMIGEFLNQHR